MAGPAFRSMAISGDVLRFIDGSEFRIKKSAAETSGEYLEMEWFLPPSTETPPKHGNWGKDLPVVYRWAYDYNVPGAPQDFIPQNEPPDERQPAGREHGVMT